MTTVTSPAARAWSSLNSRKMPRLEGSELLWIVRPRGRKPLLNDVLAHLRVVAPIVEKLTDYPDLDDLSDHSDLGQNPSFLWIRDQQLDVHALPSDAAAGRVIVQPPVLAAFTSATLDPMLDWLDEELQKDTYKQKLTKLDRSGFEERHLVLRLDASGMPPSEWLSFNRESDLPARPPRLHGRITGLWLLPEFAREVVWWTAQDGWRRIDPQDHEGPRDG